ncbi:MAG TPA: cyclopropane-fatty-acyl-phospholipid synthase family protein [Rhodopila sp.]|uniref:cyclopropane-fatty-acyl-phospholipid synthase family protein n=1 Tax=Rhodopila sp. TaxID=2480087 RepID=UPI002BFF7165|nr:cyclopropane-fatty-acyl-phospholipid synthase family protein [Rhodopila sp.]HVY15868.1 cyclopropane-fatty-acyl-phospholipid synthase family protein [Rhodopila sp.]
MQAVLDSILKRLIQTGRLTVYWPDGRSSVYQGTPGQGPTASMRLRTAAVVRRMTYSPSMAMGEGYMNGDVVAGEGGIYDLVYLAMANLQANPKGHPVARLREMAELMIRRVLQFNPAGRSRRNVAHHYDLNGRLYSLFLDRDRQYSCAYFPQGNETLEDAQAAKKRHIAAKLLLTRPGLRVLDIGCGWGGMALTLARDYGADVTGITLSQEQLQEARNRAAAEGLSERVRFEMLDYRSVQGQFDRIVSVGMFEHVGVGYYQTFFDTVARVLAPDGVALIHAIGRHDGPGSTNPWLRKYIFPGGYSPALSEVLPAIERSGLMSTDIEILRLHYAETLKQWRRRFMANRDAIASIYDDRFCRMFEFYLAASEVAFRKGGHMVWQVQLSHTHEAVPLTRDYIAAAESVPGRAMEPARQPE